MTVIPPPAEKYSAQTSLPFGPEELGAFHRFHAYDWDKDNDFQTGLQTIVRSRANSTPSQSELLKMKQYYFSTRLNTRINLDNFLAWRKHIEQPSDDSNVPIFKRFDEYNFDNDERFQQGLPSFISQLIKDGKSTLDKAALQKEITKAKAFYYARFIELFDFPAYLAWKDMEKSQAAPACPYAHLWQNKGKGTGSDLSEDAKKFLTSTSPVSTSALQIHTHSPATQNKFTGVRLAKLSQCVSEVKEKKSITSVFWTANTGKSTRNERDPESEIVTKDEQWFSGGVVGTGVVMASGESAANKELLRQYYTLVDELSVLNTKYDKPVITVIDGIVALSAAYLAFGTGGQRVITENATLAFTPMVSIEPSPHQITNAFAGLYLLAKVQSAAASGERTLPKGVGHYLAFCPDYLLRGPDLKKLGLADFFVSSTKKKDIEESILSVAGCPPPHTTQAVRMALNAEVVYPGPSKIDVWKSEIEECFGDAKSVEDIVANLEKYQNTWSKNIRDYISSLKPLFAKLLFRSIVEASKLDTFQNVARLEYRLCQHYANYLASETLKESQENDHSEMNIDSFFAAIPDEEVALFNFDFEAWLKDHQDEELANLSNSSSNLTVPSDHPKIPGVDFSDPEAIKSCPFLSAKAATESNTQATVTPTTVSSEVAMAVQTNSSSSSNNNSAIPSDHPKIPGVDFSNPEAMNGCPFLAAKSKASS